MLAALFVVLHVSRPPNDVQMTPIGGLAAVLSDIDPTLSRAGN